jgi:hypothetical protein
MSACINNGERYELNDEMVEICKKCIINTPRLLKDGCRCSHCQLQLTMQIGVLEGRLKSLSPLSTEQRANIQLLTRYIQRYLQWGGKGNGKSGGRVMATMYFSDKTGQWERV